MASILLQTFSFVYLLLFLTCTASLLSHDEECLALREFKQTILHQNYDAPGFQKLDSWRNTKSNTSDSECCLWDGVVCSNKGHVIELDLSGSSLSGTINSSSTLFKLVHLRMLNLSMNNFAESQIPSEISRLNQLRSLDLSYSGFSGQIPNEISHLIRLSWLDLSRNPLKLQSTGLEYLLQNMTRLENLLLSGVDLSSSVPRFLANFSSLRSMELDDCQLKDEFPTEIFHLPNFKFLSMQKNANLTGFLPLFHNATSLEHLDLFWTGFAGIIPESISNLNHLNFLCLQRCHFSGHIPGSLPNLTQLTYLYISENEFTGTVPSLASLTKLTTLGLSFNNFEKRNGYDWISKLVKLNALLLARMNIHDEFLPYLTNLTKLSFVSLGENFIFGCIPSSFMNLTEVAYLDLEGNQLQGPILSSFVSFKSLEYVIIGGNNLTGTLSPDSFLGLNKLKVLALDRNRLSFLTSTNYINVTLPEFEYLDLSACNLREFPAFLRFQRNMKSICLYNNEIEGLIPSWFLNSSQETLNMIGLSGNLITGFHQDSHLLPWLRLEEFEVSNNQFQGSLPIPPHTIVIYDVSKNNMTGEIPAWICELKSLRILDLSSNKMTGTLPSCFGNLHNSLWDLRLNQNHFHGPMMNTCMHGSLLREIDLSENQFIGHVSKSLANCANLEFLSLADNNFEDVFPFWLGALPNLQVLILRSNKFNGTVQGLSSISSQFHKLRIIDISNNSFSGRLPDKSFQTWNAMKYVDLGGSSAMGSQFLSNRFVRSEVRYSMTLTNKGVKREYQRILNIFTAIVLSCNHFEGQIPQSLQDLYGLESLNLSNNHFSGHILPSLGNLTNLESLDLSQNKLSGKIPQQLLHLGFLAFLNVSFNHLDGPIPQGKQFNTFENSSYMGNPGLCGKPLSKECENLKAPTVFQTRTSNDNETLLPSNIIDWLVIIFGVSSGLIIGTVIGNFVYARYGDGLLERFGLRKVRWVRPLRNTRN
ncbi:receptor-like protein 7 [Bidens hawaiensis]|uniref:receptor-like protein 7 n=1 Tax=Bidens hawaiensis TaxID=980011 RepID=UPI00404AE3D6